MKLAVRPFGQPSRRGNASRRLKSFGEPPMIPSMFNNHFREFLEFLEKRQVKYLVVGGYAVSIHGFPRYTGDLDIFVAIDAENAASLVKTFAEFGFGSLGLKKEDFLQTDNIVEIGREPMKIQVLPFPLWISGK